ncbi:similar to Saccharomyces cerevisiae YPL141C FRK1 Putative protein kinase [Maudiozyma saulgeensis]|uniref:non-specific serine/threonine protein kinase n=1 Tax=Maudiozyma saulgeensis TaxID=1789683 RepID=A0A1X7RA92_9SACH|nr:similar to Saccharomyces cerevisiae YPL141C FRK1 Putative protein kinase [Kazachstania saulgeensis]
MTTDINYTNRRHTYYGGSTTITIPHPNVSNPHASTHLTTSPENKTQRKKYPSFGPYIIGSTLGEGEFGKVKLGWSKANTSSFEIPRQVAIKLIKRDTIKKNSNKEIKIYREINALKQLNHPNIVKLDEVLQNSKYIGIVLEYASGGEFYKYIQRKKRLKEQPACRLFAQLISGVSYIHSKGLVHRDLKLENLLLDKNENLIITDFGFVNEFFSSNELMNTSCGSPCYAAPELVISTRPYEARKADIWSCGVILFAMLAGYLPWDDDIENADGNDIARLYRYITQTALKFPEYISPLPRDLLRHILVPDPTKRVNSHYIKEHKWLTSHLPFLSITPDEWDKIAFSKNILRLPKHTNKQNMNSNSNNSNNNNNHDNQNNNLNHHFNKPRPLSACSTSSTNSNGEKRDSLLIDSTLLVFPVPPRESQSHVLTMPSLPSPERRPSSSRNGHTRSNSAASLALQAVVDAERELLLQRNRTSSITSTNTNNNYAIKSENGPLSRRSTSSHSERNILYNANSPIISLSNMNAFGISTSSSSQNGDSSLMNKNSAILESPTKTSIINNDVFNELRLQDNQSKNTSYFHSHTNNGHRKLRPTSYHPGNFSTVLEQNGSNIDAWSPSMLNKTSGVTIRKELSPFESPPKLQRASDGARSAHSLEMSPKLYPRRSFSIKSKISLDVESVSGDLIKSTGNIDTTIKKLHEQVDEIALKPKNINDKEIQSPTNTNTQTNGDALSDLPPRMKPIDHTSKKRFSLFPFYSGYQDNLSYRQQDGKENVMYDSSTISGVNSRRTLNKHNPHNNSKQRASIMISSMNEYQPSLPTMREHPDDHEDILQHPTYQNSHRPSTTRKVINFFKTRSVRL